MVGYMKRQGGFRCKKASKPANLAKQLALFGLVLRNYFRDGIRWN